MTSTETDSTSPTPQHVVVGVDGSAGGDAALAWALRQAWANGGSVTAVGAWQTPVMSGAAGYGSFADLSSFDLTAPTQERLDKSVAAATADLPVGVTVLVTTSVVGGYPSRVLLHAAADADLLVVGSRGHGELSGMLLGSVGLHCVTHGTCPVVVVPHIPAAA